MTSRKSVTREMRKIIHNQKIRKNILSMYREYDEDWECDVITINFRENTMVNVYDWEISNRTAVVLNEKKFTEEHLINGWLEEVYMPLEDCTEEDQKYLLAHA